MRIQGEQKYVLLAGMTGFLLGICSDYRVAASASGDLFVCSGEIPARCVNARRDKGKQRIRPRDVVLAPDTDRCVI